MTACFLIQASLNKREASLEGNCSYPKNPRQGMEPGLGGNKHRTGKLRIKATAYSQEAMWSHDSVSSSWIWSLFPPPQHVWDPQARGGAGTCTRGLPRRLGDTGARRRPGGWRHWKSWHWSRTRGMRTEAVGRTVLRASPGGGGGWRRNSLHHPRGLPLTASLTREFPHSGQETGD